MPLTSALPTFLSDRFFFSLILLEFGRSPSCRANFGFPSMFTRLSADPVSPPRLLASRYRIYEEFFPVIIRIALVRSTTDFNEIISFNCSARLKKPSRSPATNCIYAILLQTSNVRSGYSSLFKLFSKDVYSSVTFWRRAKPK